MATDSSAACCNPPLPATPEHVGKEETIAGQAAYITGPPSASAAVILIPEIFGYKTPLFPTLADKVAAAGYLTFVPDVLNGDPLPGTLEAYPECHSKHPLTGHSLTLTKNLVKVVKKSKGIDSIGVAEFCWGAKVAVCLEKETTYVKAVVQLHPSGMEASD